MSRILLLEDDLSLIDGLSYSLKKQGFEIDIFRMMNEANDLWSDGKYDLLILDYPCPTIRDLTCVKKCV